MVSDHRQELAAFTVVHDEPEFLPRWLSHYYVQGAQVLYVLRHVDDPVRLPNQVPPSPRVVEVPVCRKVFYDHEWLAAQVSHFAAWLLWSYKAVLFAEADEFLLPDPATGCNTLRELLDARPGAEWLRAQGFEVVQAEGEPSLDPSRWPWLANRRYWYPTELYSKTLLLRRSPGWKPGFHEIYAARQPALDPGLILVHLRKIDFELAVTRNQRSAALQWNPADLATGQGWQNRLQTREEIAAHFAEHPDDRQPILDRVQEIPAWVQQHI